MLDHLVLGTADLEKGAFWLERFFGVTLSPVGQHLRMGTHNRLLSLGDACYLELISIDPHGFIWLGRNWNLPPASAAGHNGNEKFGPFMFEMIGNFDMGHDPFDGAQRETALKVIDLVQSRFELAPNTLMFHNAMSAKSCPGGSLDYAEILAAVEKCKAALVTVFDMK